MPELHAFVARMSEQTGEHGALVPPWVFGLTGFGILVGLLILTTMINVKR